MARYTAKMLQDDLDGINRKLKGIGHGYYLKVYYEYGHTYVVRSLRSDTSHGHWDVGGNTPALCYAAAQDYYDGVLRNLSQTDIDRALESANEKLATLNPKREIKIEYGRFQSTVSIWMGKLCIDETDCDSVWECLEVILAYLEEILAHLEDSTEE